MTPPIEMSSAELDEHDVEAVASVVRSGQLALGPRIQEFEREVATIATTAHAVAVNSGTAALHLIVRALGLGAEDQVVVPSFTFAASVNAILYEGATPVFADIESDTFNLDPTDFERRITDRTKAVMVVDVFGHPAAWDRILDIAKRNGLYLIDDSCEAFGAEYRGRKLGSLGDAAAFAFYPNKQMTTGEGGIIVTDNDETASLCRSMRNQGRSEMGSWLEHERLGFNYRMDEMSAALGVSQMRRLDEILAKRAAVADRYTQMLAGYDWVRPPVVRPRVKISWFVYVVTLARGIDRDAVMRLLDEDGIPSRAYFSPIHRQPYIVERFGERDYDLPVTEDIASRTLALPFHNNLTQEQAERVVSSLVSAVERVA